jgi:hypothetical protein
VGLLRHQRGREFRAAADRYDAIQFGRVSYVAGNVDDLNWDGVNRDGNPFSRRGGQTSGENVILDAELDFGDLLIAAVHESYHLPAGGAHTDEDTSNAAERRAYYQLNEHDRKEAPRTAHDLGEKPAKKVIEPRSVQ